MLSFECQQTLLATYTAELSRYDTQLAAYQSELGTELQSQLDVDDQEQVRNLYHAIDIYMVV